jgi:uncharacterized protein YkwD
MRRNSLWIAGLAVATTLGLGAGTGAAAVPLAKPVVPKTGLAVQKGFEREVFIALNKVRRARGLRPLRGSRVLARSARAHSAYMARKRKLTHVGAGRLVFWQRFLRYGYRENTRMSEIIGRRNVCRRGDPRIIVRAWLRSPRHRVLMLDRKIRYMGTGVVSTARCRNTFYTSDFGG